MISSGITGGAAPAADLTAIMNAIATDPAGFQAKVEEFSKAKAAAEESIARAALVGEIGTLHAQATADAAEARALKMNTEAGAQAIIDAAKEEAERILKNALANADDINGAAKAAEEEAATRLASVASAEAELGRERRAFAVDMNKAAEDIASSRSRLEIAQANATQAEKAALAKAAALDDKVARINAIAQE